MPSAPTRVDLEGLHSLDDRLALAELVASVLQPPENLARLHGQLRERWDAATPGERAALDAQADWAGTGLREAFVASAKTMLEWAARLHLHGDVHLWSPKAWVQAAAAHGATPLLLALVIEQAPTVSWPGWRQAFGVHDDWVGAWHTWEGCFERSPSLALRWLDDLLQGRPRTDGAGSSPSDRALGQLRGRVAAGQFAPSAPPALTQQVSDRLRREGIPLLLDGVDWSFALLDGEAVRTPVAAAEAVAAFLRQHAGPARDWLAEGARTRQRVLPLDALHARAQARHAAVVLKMLAQHGQASASALREVGMLLTRNAPPAVGQAWVKATHGWFAEWDLPPPRAQRPRPARRKAASTPPLPRTEGSAPPEAEASAIALPIEDANAPGVDVPRFARR